MFIKAPFRAPLTGSPPSEDASRLRPRSDWAYSLRPWTRWEKQGPAKNPKSRAKIKPGGDENGQDEEAKRGGRGVGGAFLDNWMEPVRMHERQRPADWTQRRKSPFLLHLIFARERCMIESFASTFITLIIHATSRSNPDCRPVLTEHRSNKCDFCKSALRDSISIFSPFCAAKAV